MSSACPKLSMALERCSLSQLPGPSPLAVRGLRGSSVTCPGFKDDSGLRLD